MKAKNIAIIKEFEGLELKSYLCPAGVWTIGFGHTKNVMPGQTISEEWAEIFLKEDLAEAEKCVEKNLPGLNQSQFDALVSFVFNVGCGAFYKSTLLKLIRKNETDFTIFPEFGKWVNANGKPLPGLIRRRRQEAKLYFSEL